MFFKMHILRVNQQLHKNIKLKKKGYNARRSERLNINFLKQKIIRIYGIKYIIENNT